MFILWYYSNQSLNKIVPKVIKSIINNNYIREYNE